MKKPHVFKQVVSLVLLVFVAGAGAAVSAVATTCGPFTDVGTLICPFVLELYYSGIAAGTSSTTFSPGASLTRGQMAVFTAAALDLSIDRGARRAALDQWWVPTPHYDAGLGLTTVAPGVKLLKGDGTDIWVTGLGAVSRVRASDGALLGAWTGAGGASGVLPAMGRVFVAGTTDPGSLYMIDPTQAPGAVTTVSSSLGKNPEGIAFDGSSIWTANSGGSVSRITPGTSPGNWSVSTFTTGFSSPQGAVFAAGSIWITDTALNALLRLNGDGTIAQAVVVGGYPAYPAFDGRNIWVPNFLDSSLTVVRASDGAVLQTFSAANGNQNGLSFPAQAAFCGAAVAVTNQSGSVSLFRAADLSVLGNVPTPGLSIPFAIASDGVDFWISDSSSSSIGRF